MGSCMLRASVQDKKTSRNTTKSTYQISTSQPNLEGIRKMNSKNKKIRPKNQILGTVRACYKAEKSKPTKGISSAPTKFTYLISTS